MPNQIIPNREQYDATVALNYSGMSCKGSCTTQQRIYEGGFSMVYVRH